MNKHHKWIFAVAVVIGVVAIVLYDPVPIADDEDVADQAIAVLSSQPNVDASRLRVSVHDGVVTIIGQLSSDESRHLAMEEVKKIRGVDRIIDKIEIDVAVVDEQSESEQ